MPRITLLGLAVAALALSACGGGTSGAGADPQSLVGTSYDVTAITVDGTQREVLGPVVITFEAETLSVATPCNGMGGDVTYSPTTLTVGPLAATLMACEPELMEQDRVIAEALEADPTWQLVDGTLTLTGAGTSITGTVRAGS